MDTRTSSDVVALYLSHRDELRQFLHRRFGDGPPEPDDIVQAAFAKFAALDDPSKVENPRAFLYAAARNLTIDAVRRNGLSRRHSAEVAADFQDEQAEQISPERVLLAGERYAIVRAAIAAMPEAQRDVLILHRLEGLSMDAIAKRTRTSKTTVHRQIVNAVALLHRALQHAE